MKHGTTYVLPDGTVLVLNRIRHFGASVYAPVTTAADKLVDEIVANVPCFTRARPADVAAAPGVGRLHQHTLVTYRSAYIPEPYGGNMWIVERLAVSDPRVTVTLRVDDNESCFVGPWLTSPFGFELPAPIIVNAGALLGIRVAGPNPRRHIRIALQSIYVTDIDDGQAQ